MFRSPFYPAPLAHYNCTFHTVFTLNYTWLAHLFTPLDDDSETTSPSTVFVRKGVQLYDFSLPLPLFWASTLPQSTRHLVEVIPTIGCFQPPVDWRLKQHDIYVPTHKDDIGENYPLLNYNPRFPLEPLKTTEWGNKLISPFFITPSVPTSTLDQLTSIPQANMNNNYMYSTLHNLHRPPLVNTLVTDFPWVFPFPYVKNLHVGQRVPQAPHWVVRLNVKHRGKLDVEARNSI